jgi:hypothetical protein
MSHPTSHISRLTPIRKITAYITHVQLFIIQVERIIEIYHILHSTSHISHLTPQNYLRVITAYLKGSRFVLPIRDRTSVTRSRIRSRSRASTCSQPSSCRTTLVALALLLLQVARLRPLLRLEALRRSEGRSLETGAAISSSRPDQRQRWRFRLIRSFARSVSRSVGRLVGGWVGWSVGRSSYLTSQNCLHVITTLFR